MAHNTSAELEVPFLSDYEYIGSAQSEINHVYGRFWLTQVLPTPTLPNSATPVYKVYVRFEDIELFGTSPVSSTVFIVPQSGAKTPGDKELENNGQLSGVLATAARLPRAVARALPSLAPFMGATSWFLSASARAAAAFGFSKPVITKTDPVYRLGHIHEANVDMPVPAVAVGAFAGNQVAVSSALGCTDLDEMAFDTVLTRPSQIFRGTLTTADTHSTNKYVSQVCINHFWFRAPAPGVDRGNISFPRSNTLPGGLNTAVIPSTLLYFGQHFRLWHGDLTYRVTFAKSKFHTGRVMFSFIPNYQRVSNGSTYAEAGLEGGPLPGTSNGELQPTQYSMVFDLKDGSTFDFDVPFFAPTSMVGVNDSLGMVCMQVMDPLVANGESSDTISFIVEVAAKPGFYFSGIAGPASPAWCDLSPSPSIVFQSGVGGHSADASQHSAGEKFLSVKQLMMHPLMRRYTQANNSTVTGTIPQWPCLPSWGDGNPLASNVLREFPFSRAGLVAQCYAFGIGSTVLYVQSAGLGSQSLFRVLSNRFDNAGALTGTVPGLYGSTTIDPNTAWAQFSRGSQTTEAYLLPTLSASPRFRTGDLLNTNTTRDWGPGITSVSTLSIPARVTYQFSATNLDGAARVWSWGTAAADDARVAAWIGPCPIILAASTSTTPSWYSSGAAT
uniref:Capsid protein n=1 Tax=Biomphalaria pfeifferi virus 2 TaxID=2884320 RepID=A0A8K1P8E3_9VIRU|nr:MAG: capsid protein precursor [Biomphalaria pfeifferi virus 2]